MRPFFERYQDALERLRSAKTLDGFEAEGIHQKRYADGSIAYGYRPKDKAI